MTPIERRIETLRKEIAKLGPVQAERARKLDVSLRCLQYFEAGEGPRYPSVATLVAIEKALGLCDETDVARSVTL